MTCTVTFFISSDCLSSLKPSYRMANTMIASADAKSSGAQTTRHVTVVTHKFNAAARLCIIKTDNFRMCTLT